MTAYDYSPWWETMLQNGTMIPVVSIVFGGMLVLAVACGLMCIGFVKALRGGGSTRELRFLQQQEAQDFQELERGFRRMEERLDSLETLLIGRSQAPARMDAERELD